MPAREGDGLQSSVATYKKPREPSYFFFIFSIIIILPQLSYPYLTCLQPSHITQLCNKSFDLKMVSEKPQKPKGRLVPRLTAAEEQQQRQEQMNENARAIRTSIAALHVNTPFDHIGQGNLQIPENATEATTTMQHQLGMTVPTGLNMDWPGFPSQDLGDSSYFATSFGASGEKNVSGI